MKQKTNNLRFVFLGHHKCASSWLNRLFWNLFTDAGIPYRVYRFVEPEDRSEIEKLIGSAESPLAFGVSNARPEDVELFEGFQGIHVVRDPREMLVSGYYSHRDSHPLFPGLEEERKLLKSVSFEAGLFEMMDGLMKSTFLDMLDWPEVGNSGIKELKFEDITGDYFILAKSFQEMGFVDNDRLVTSWPLRAWNQFAKRKLNNRFMVGRERLMQSSFDIHLQRLLASRKRKQKHSSKKGAGHHRPKKKERWFDVMTDEHQEGFERRFPGLVEKWSYPSWSQNPKVSSGGDDSNH